MTCVLTIPVLYQNQYSDNVTAFKYLDFNWMMNGCQQSGFVENQDFCSYNQVDTNKDSTNLCQLEHSDGVSRKVTHGQNNAPPRHLNGKQIKTIISDNQSLSTGNEDSFAEDTMCIGTETGQGEFDLTKHCVKRKADIKDCDEVYIPSKRVSPFLNTPKGRKDEMKSVLKICMKKIKELDDPEIFLRRSVLVNNLTRRLQNELQQEKHNSRKFSSYKGNFFSDYEVLNNNCWSATYLCDDPFLSGSHEVITDDMTDTLINNVLS